MKKTIFFSFLLIFSLIVFTNKIFADYWSKTYGSNNSDYPTCIQKTSDEGFIVAGVTSSFGAGSNDYWILKLDANGNIQWQKTYGGTNYDGAHSIQQTSDGGYIVAGYTSSFGAGSNDYWILKLDANGNIQWQKTYGEDNNDAPYSIQQTSDGGYIVAGKTYSFGAGISDYWILKLDADGNVQWQRTYGGTSAEYVSSIQQTSDGGFIVVGDTLSFGAGDYDWWILKLYDNGSIQWQKTYGGENYESPNSVQQTSDGGFIVAGRTESFGAGDSDSWILKLDANGNVEWQKAYGGQNYESALSIQQTSDNGYIVIGITNSFGAGGNDYWILKLDANGNIQWQKTYGGTDDDYGLSIQQTSDSGFIVAGDTKSFGAGDYDSWILKLDQNGDIPNCFYGQTTDATVTNTNVTDNDTNASVNSPDFSSDNTSITPSDTNATVYEICYYKQITKNVPTLNEWGIIILTILSGLFGIFYLNRKEI